MRAASSHFESFDPTESFLGVLDQFAAVRSYSSAPAVGGFRLLSPKSTIAHRAKRALAPTPAAIAALARARMRLTGFLSVLFVGGLGLAVLAGPATCSCTIGAMTAQATSLTRLGYIENAHFIAAREQLAPETAVPTLSLAKAIDSPETTKGVSPITTSALLPAAEVTSTRSDSQTPPSSNAALPAHIESLADAGPTVKLAALSESDLPEISPNAPKTSVAAREQDADASDEDRPRKHHKRAIRAYRTPVAARPATRSKSSGDAMTVKRAPKWAQQMYVTPWQMQAFSYTR
ncbi:hypothetical protein [Hyphomicrobium sp. NDB2Meth4]|uniref:hypothetical protein n=1 Tax=Hyphomicrobium sp. NDB2Meth4 TaxID=1892846 RepID=UPI0009311988|nr:hypothetical protein [Hyphomicrobium sp. NDB2Meth4]